MIILIAEDDPSIRQHIGGIVKEAGHKALFAEDGTAAWKILKEHEINLVISDWVMPGIEGPALCRMIREADFPRYIYSILLTSKDRSEDYVAGLESGADDYIAKPINKEELAVRIRSGQRIVDLEDNLKRSHMQLLQSEKMASIGQLAAGVAHEINNPTGFVSSNLKMLQEYHPDIHELFRGYQAALGQARQVLEGREGAGNLLAEMDRLAEKAQEKQIDYILDDVGDLIKESREGTERIKRIVQDLKSFAHPGDEEKSYADINGELDSVLNVLTFELKHRIKINKEYGDIPEVLCYPHKLNQTFMNLLINGAQAIPETGEITIKTSVAGDFIEVAISDTGKGIPEKNLSRIFEPFFTTKEVGTGTGLGLYVVYQIIEGIGGEIKVRSTCGKGTTFLLRIPMTEMERIEN
ncbi:MAG: response regulator [Planctomycetota bacterium]